jgi:hypothetical protein
MCFMKTLHGMCPSAALTTIGMITETRARRQKAVLKFPLRPQLSLGTAS